MAEEERLPSKARREGAVGREVRIERSLVGEEEDARREKMVSL